MHSVIEAMLFEKKEQVGTSYLSSAPLAKAFNIIGEEERKKVKFDIDYFIATAKMAFTRICKELQLLSL